MSNSFKHALQSRRSVYAINDKSPISDEQIQEIVDFALMNVPSAFNSQSTRLVLLLGEQHKKLWNGIVMDTLRAIVPAENFGPTEAKINSFAAGYGTVLFFEDNAVVEGLQSKFAAYADNFPLWARDTSAMHQLTIWTLLEEAGLGASLQHYNPIIDDQVKETWGLDKKWHLTSQMVFGGIVQKPETAPEKQPVEDRRKFFK
ncbi:nitroreductase family protein [Microvirga sp. W0021]|uniref:Nitroreductase family protein n=1 Tax=Hohaiivirga grylli TaxID=3133970 RepID=A0ABV0BK72_9HYPH